VIGLIPILAVPMTAGLVFLINWLALIPWRRSKGLHWSEAARVLYPARVAARSNLWAIPGCLILAIILCRPGSTLLWILAGAGATVGVVLGTIPMEREIFPRISVRSALRQSAIGWLLRFFIWFVFLSAAILMPDEFGAQTAVIAAGVVLLATLWSRDGLVWFGRKVGLFLPAPERLRRIVTETASRMNVPFRQLLLMRVPMAQAFAIPRTRTLLFTERILELLSDEELASVCSHELAHLTESRRARYLRSARVLAFLPWIFYRPLVHTFGTPAFFGLCFMTILVPYFSRKLSVKLETRADAIAKANETDSGTYARALLRLYEDGLLPTVTSKNRKTHPDLYDRVLVAGVNPDFAKPRAARSMSLHGVIFSALVGVLFAFVAMREMGAFERDGHYRPSADETPATQAPPATAP
jgi:Zn-dependent protease with chaperone function